VVLEGDEREGGLPVLTEGEAEGVELRSGEAIIELGRNRLGGGGRREGGGDQGRVGRILFINDLATDEELHLGDDGGPVVSEGVRDGIAISIGTVMGMR
jgi:hypothetical protein